MSELNMMDGFRLGAKGPDIVYSDRLNIIDENAPDHTQSKQCFAVRNLQDAKWVAYLVINDKADILAKSVGFPKVVALFEEHIIVPDHIPSGQRFELEAGGTPHYQDHPDYSDDPNEMARKDLFQLLDVREI